MPKPERLLAIIQDGSRSYNTRRRAFEQLLELREGFWGQGALRDFLIQAATRSAYRLAGYGADLLDPEGIADEVLVLFFESAPTLTEPVNKWFLSHVKSLAFRARDREREMLNAERIGPLSKEASPEEAKPIDLPAPEPPRWVSAKARAASRRDERDIWLAVNQLPPTLRSVVEVKLVEGEDVSLVAIAQRLHIKPDTVRQRWRRGRHRLQAMLQGLMERRQSRRREAA